MSLAYNTLKGSDVTVTPIKLKYSNVIPSGSLTDSGITLTVASNASFDYYDPYYGDNFLLYRSVQGLYYMNFISGSTSGSAFDWSPQSTAASGTFDNDYRYFPTSSEAQVLVISIPRAKFGENIARSSFSISSSNYNIVDDGNGNLIDVSASNVHVGNLLYNQGIGIITNVDYIYTLTPVPVCKVPTLTTPYAIGATAAAPTWEPIRKTYEYVLSTSSLAPVGAGSAIDARLGIVALSGLTPESTYYFFLRSKCSSTSYSSWVSESFTTTADVCAVPTFLPFSVDSGSVIANWNPPGNPTLYYEYVVATSSVTPIGSGTDVLADSGTKEVTGLTPSTNYYFFLRSRCSVSNYSSWVSESFTTTADTYGLVPFRTDLILELESFTGSNYDGFNRMTSWKDMSGYGNDVYSIAPTSVQYYPVYSSSYFSGQPGIYFTSSYIDGAVTASAMQTQANLSGLSGSTGMTLFIVGDFRSNNLSNLIIEYAKSGSDYNAIGSTGSFAWLYEFTGSNIKPTMLARGNVGYSQVETIAAYPSSSHVYIGTTDFTLPTNEAIAYVDNVSGLQDYTLNVNNSGSFGEYKLSIGGPVKDGRWLSGKGHIGAVLLYKKVLTNSERTQVYNYLSSSYL
jgi:hypothetical protein